ncbi:Release factor glutamine methyltransferase [Candidatus Hepatincola sp. Av]
MRLQNLYQQAITTLTTANFIENHSLEARILLKHVLNLTDDAIFIQLSNTLIVTPTQQQKVQQLIKRRLQGEPIAYIVGYKDFWQSRFQVNKNVLIPRADSETLIEAMLQEVAQESYIDILDLGIGSGCLLFSLLQEYPNARGIGTDVSSDALAVAQTNGLMLKIKNYTLLQTNLFIGLTQKFHVIISNPPYIAFNDNNIALETKNFEPVGALYAKDDGLFFYKEILRQAKSYLYPKGKIFLEIGFNQTDALIELLQAYNYSNYKFFKDLAGINRVVAIFLL